MQERQVVDYLKKRVKAYGGEARKCHWEGRTGAPDWLIWFPRSFEFPAGISAYVEAKATGEKPKPHQLIEHQKMREGGMIVWVCDSRESIDRFIEMLKAYAGYEGEQC